MVNEKSYIEQLFILMDLIDKNPLVSHYRKNFEKNYKIDRSVFYKAEEEGYIQNVMAGGEPAYNLTIKGIEFLNRLRLNKGIKELNQSTNNLNAITKRFEKSSREQNEKTRALTKMTTILTYCIFILTIGLFSFSVFSFLNNLNLRWYQSTGFTLVFAILVIFAVFKLNPLFKKFLKKWEG